jgi:hypothetical protein
LIIYGHKGYEKKNIPKIGVDILKIMGGFTHVYTPFGT